MNIEVKHETVKVTLSLTLGEVSRLIDELHPAAQITSYDESLRAKLRECLACIRDGKRGVIL